MSLGVAIFGAVNCDPGQSNAMAGTPSWVGVTVSGGLRPYTVTISSGSLPPGMTLNPIRIGAGGGLDCFEITGTPTTPGTYTFNVHAVDTVSTTGDVSGTIIVAAVENFEMGFPPAAQSVPYSFQLDDDYATSLFVFGGGPFTPPFTYGPIFWSPSNPTLSISAGGLITGTPTASTFSPFNPSAFEASVVVTDFVGHVLSANNSLTIYGIPVSITCGSPPEGSVGVAYTHTFPIAHGVGPFDFEIISGALPDGLSLNSTTGQVTGVPTLAGTFPFTVEVTDTTGFSAQANCSIEIVSGTPSVECDSPPDGTVGIPYSHAFPASGGVPPYVWGIVGPLPDGLSLDADTGVVSGTPTVAANFPFTVEVTDSTLATAEVECSITIHSAPVVECGNPPNGAVGIIYSHTFPASGGTPPYTWAILSGSLPGGLALNPATGEVSGTPTIIGTSAFLVGVTDSLGATASVSCSITIESELIASCNNPPGGTLGVLYTHFLGVTGGVAPYVWSIAGGELPSGLVLNPGTGEILGTPTLAAEFFFAAHVEDSLGAAGDISCSILISGASPPPESLCPGAPELIPGGTLP